MRKELALLVKQGSKGTSGLPRASTFLQIQPFTYWGCGLRPAGSTHRDVLRLMQLSVAPPTTQTPTLCSAAPDRQFHIGKLSVLFHCKPFILRHANMDSRRKPYDLVWVMTAVILTSGVVGEHGCKYASVEFELISKSNQCLLLGLPGTFYKMNKVHFSYTSVILGWIHTVPSVIELNCVKDAILAVQCQVLPINSALN